MYSSNNKNIKTTEIDSVDFMEKIIQKPAQEKKTIVLSFLNEMNIRDVFEFLMEFFTRLSVAKHGNNGQVDITIWSEQDFQLIKEYFNSFGYDIKYEMLDMDKDYVRLHFLMNNHFYKNITTRPNIKLNDYYYILNMKKNNKSYAINFDILY
jgi:hypothetical protein